MGRPKSADPMVPIHARLPESIAAAVTAVASFNRTSESELIRRFVESGLRAELKTAEERLAQEQAAERARLDKVMTQLAVAM